MEAGIGVQVADMPKVATSRSAVEVEDRRATKVAPLAEREAASIRG